MGKYLLLPLIALTLTAFFQQDKAYKFCIKAAGSKYVVKITQDERQSATFNLYDYYDKLIKTTSGTWELREEGVYGTATYIIYKFTGANAQPPDMKFMLIRDGNGSPQEIRDSQDRIWSRCY